MENILLSNKSDDLGCKIATIIKKVSTTSYSVKDKKGRVYVVNAADSFLVGQSVIIKNGIILGKTKSSQSFKEFNI